MVASITDVLNNLSAASGGGPPSGLSQFQRSYEIAPIILVGGLAQNLPGSVGGMISILALTEGDASANYDDVNQYFARFKVLPGGTLADWSAAQYPLASMQMAANAVLKNALRVSLLMLTMAQAGQNNYAIKSSRFSTITSQLNAHVALGGLFTVATPAYTYENCILLTLRDVSPSAEKQVQTHWQWDFYQPLVTQAAAASSYNSTYNKLANGLPLTSPVDNSGVQNTQGNAATSQPPGATS